MEFQRQHGKNASSNTLRLPKAILQVVHGVEAPHMSAYPDTINHPLTILIITCPLLLHILIRKGPTCEPGVTPNINAKPPFYSMFFHA